MQEKKKESEKIEEMRKLQQRMIDIENEKKKIEEEKWI